MPNKSTSCKQLKNCDFDVTLDFEKLLPDDPFLWISKLTPPNPSNKIRTYLNYFYGLQMLSTTGCHLKWSVQSFDFKNRIGLSIYFINASGEIYRDSYLISTFERSYERLIFLTHENIQLVSTILINKLGAHFVDRFYLNCNSGF